MAWKHWAVLAKPSTSSFNSIAQVEVALDRLLVMGAGGVAWPTGAGEGGPIYGNAPLHASHMEFQVNIYIYKNGMCTHATKTCLIHVLASYFPIIFH